MEDPSGANPARGGTGVLTETASAVARRRAGRLALCHRQRNAVVNGQPLIGPCVDHASLKLDVDMSTERPKESSFSMNTSDSTLDARGAGARYIYSCSAPAPAPARRNENHTSLDAVELDDELLSKRGTWRSPPRMSPPRNWCSSFASQPRGGRWPTTGSSSPKVRPLCAVRRQYGQCQGIGAFDPLP